MNTSRAHALSPRASVCVDDLRSEEEVSCAGQLPDATPVSVRDVAEGNAAPTRRRWAVEVLRDTALGRVCVWYPLVTSVIMLWSWIEGVVAALEQATGTSGKKADEVRPVASKTVREHQLNALRGIEKIVRVDHQGDHVRFDLFVSNERVRYLIQALRWGAKVMDRGVRVIVRAHTARRAHRGASHGASTTSTSVSGEQTQSPATAVVADSGSDTVALTERRENRRRSYAEVAASPVEARVSTLSLSPVRKLSGSLRTEVFAVSWNVNALLSKRPEVEACVSVHQASIVALQETRWNAAMWRIRLPGYCVFSEPAVMNTDDHSGTKRGSKVPKKVAARGGLCIAIASRFSQSVTVVGRRSPYTMFVRVLLQHNISLIVGNVYVPPKQSGNSRRKAAIESISENVKSLFESFPASVFMILGDWNMSAEKVQQTLDQIAADSGSESTAGRLRVIAPEGAAADKKMAFTYHLKGVAKSALDHCVIGGGNRCLRESIAKVIELAKCRVDRGQDASDHWPLVTRLQLKSMIRTSSSVFDDQGETQGASEFVQYLEKKLGEDAVQEWSTVPDHRRGKRITLGGVQRFVTKAAEAAKQWRSSTIYDVLDSAGLIPSVGAVGKRPVSNVSSTRGRQIEQAIVRSTRSKPSVSVDTIRCAPQWAELVEQAKSIEQRGVTAEELNVLAQASIDTMYQVASSVGLTSRFPVTEGRCGRDDDSGSDGAKSHQERRYLSRLAIQLAARKRALYVAWRRDRSKQALARYNNAKRQFRTLVRDERTASWTQFIANGVSQLSIKRNSAAYWQWIRAVSGIDFARSGSSSASFDMYRNTRVNAIQDPITREMLQDPSDIQQAWNRHFSTLAEDSTGHSRDAHHWEQFAESLKRYEQELPGVNDDLTWPEARMVLESFGNAKAPGLDGVPGGFIKLILQTTAHDCDSTFVESHATELAKLSPKQLVELIEAKLVTESERHASRGTEPSSPMADVLFRLLNLMWTGEMVPQCWQSAWMVQVPKKGDATVMDNYRGISLIDFMTKWLSKIVVRRIASALETTGRLCREQAGFRATQECTGQVVTLIEIVQRRRAIERNTYAAFLDFSKAYDMVPHMALFAKLDAIGIRGRTLSLIKQMYGETRFAVRTPLSQPLGAALPHRIEMVHQLKGLRQGCPMSPTLFNVFINDLFDGHRIQNVGVHCHFLPNKARNAADQEHVDMLFNSFARSDTGATLVPGLLFADDAVILASSLKNLKRSLNLCTQWADRNEMRFNAAKCGAMAFGKERKKRNRKSSSTQNSTAVPTAADRVVNDSNAGVVDDNQDQNVPNVTADRVAGARSNTVVASRAQNRLVEAHDQLLLQNHLVPVVDRYVYLGVEITGDLDPAAMARHRLAIAQTAIELLRPFFGNQAIPTIVRALVLKSVVIPMALYGAEIWGMVKSTVRTIQKRVNQCIRLITGCASTVCVVGIAAELNIIPIHAQATARRARAFAKWSNVHSPTIAATWIGALCLSSRLKKTSVVGVSHTWVSSLIQWIKVSDKAESKRVADMQHDTDGEELMEVHRLVHGNDTSIQTLLSLGMSKDLSTADDTQSTVPLHQRVYDCVIKRLYRQEVAANKSKSLANFIAFGFCPVLSSGGVAAASRWLSAGLRAPELSKGFALLLRLRADVAALGPELVLRKKLGTVYSRASCPCCKRRHLNGGESRAHLLLECGAWTTVRRQLLSGVIERALQELRARERAAGRMHSVDLRNITVRNNVAVLILGGRLDGGKVYLRDWANVPGWCVSDEMMLQDDDQEPGSKLPSGCVDSIEIEQHTGFWNAPADQESVPIRCDDEIDQERFDDDDQGSLDDDAEVASRLEAFDHKGWSHIEEHGVLKVALFLQTIWPVRSRLVGAEMDAYARSLQASTSLSDE